MSTNRPSMKRTILIDLAICGAIIAAVVLIPVASRRATGKPNCGKLYFHVLGAVNEESPMNTPDVDVAVYGMEIDQEGDTLYKEVEPYHLGDGWFLVDNCTVTKKIQLRRNDTGMQVILADAPAVIATNMAIDSIRLRYGVYLIRYDGSYRPLRSQIPGQGITDVVDITPADWRAARTDIATPPGIR